jgi:hypothetical protein
MAAVALCATGENATVATPQRGLYQPIILLLCSLVQMHTTFHFNYSPYRVLSYTWRKAADRDGRPSLVSYFVLLLYYAVPHCFLFFERS